MIPTFGSDDFESLQGLATEQNTDVAGLKAMALQTLSEQELEEQLDRWDVDPEALLGFYTRLAARIDRAYPELPWSDAIERYVNAIWQRDYPYPGTEEGSARHQWSMLLDIPLHETTGREPQSPALSYPPYRLVGDTEELTAEDYSRGLELLCKKARRVRRPIDRYPPQGEPWRWPQRTDAISLAVRSAVRDLDPDEMEPVSREWFLTRFAELLEPAAPF